MKDPYSGRLERIFNFKLPWSTSTGSQRFYNGRTVSPRFMSNFASGYVKYINHLEQINDAAVSDPARMIDEVEDAYHDHLENIARNITSHHQGCGW